MWYTNVRLFYTTVAHPGTNTVSIDAGGFQAGAFAVIYKGVGTPVVDTQSGNAATIDGAAFDAGVIETTDEDLIVAVFVDGSNHVPLLPAAGAKLVAHDDAFSAMIEDLPGPAGNYTPRAMLPASLTSSCWVGASVALRPRR